MSFVRMRAKQRLRRLALFWRPFLVGSDVPLVIFSNAAFIGRPESGMRYYNPADDPHERIFDHYTGVGEVLAVHNLDHVFALLHRQIIVKRGSLFSLDDAKNNDLIFVGSPSENLTLQEIPGTREFVFQRLASGPRKGDLAIVNVHPAAGEATAFLASPSNAQLVEDYAVVSMMQGFNSSHTVMILAGTTTFGTQERSNMFAGRAPLRICCCGFLCLMAISSRLKHWCV